MLDLRPISLVIGYMLVVLGASMIIPAAFDFAAGSQDWRGFLFSAALTVFTGLALVLAGRTAQEQSLQKMHLRQAFLLTSLSWIMISVFAALPFVFVKVHLNITNAIFEAVSGFSTTGSTVIAGLDSTSAGTLLWRGLLQWAGGVGIIVTAIAVLPMLQVGGMQLFHMESSDRSEEKILPRIAQITQTIGLIYLGFSAACAVSFWFGGMSPFDAAVNMMGTVSTGGFATSDKSFGLWNSPAIDTAAIIFMFIGALPIMLFLPALRGKPMALLGDSQVQTFAAITALAVAALTAFQWANGINDGWRAFRYAAFNAVSAISGTGFMNTDYGLWGPFVSVFFIYIILLGGCSGSASCGLKVFRLQVLYLATLNQIRRIMYPNGIFTVRYNGRPLSYSTISSVTGYLFLYMMTFAASGSLLVAMGMDMTSAFSAAATTLANCGPGMGPIVGPAGNYSTLNAPQIWVLTITMLLGRLELLTVYVLFLPRFWRR
ncbi:MAG: TrkH family potassium uptake protein [Alphaproteobacteria bacterium]|nr:TrkH family potassium uptake protein [Alphaproteobacteria bacterium]